MTTGAIDNADTVADFVLVFCLCVTMKFARGYLRNIEWILALLRGGQNWTASIAVLYATIHFLLTKKTICLSAFDVVLSQNVH